MNTVMRQCRHISLDTTPGVRQKKCIIGQKNNCRNKGTLTEN